MRELYDILRCPDCHNRLNVEPRQQTASGRVKSGGVWCEGCRTYVGAVRQFRFDFVCFRRDALTRASKDGLLRLPAEVVEERIASDDARIICNGVWVHHTDALANAGIVGQSATVTGDFLDIEVSLVKHARGGVAILIVDGHIASELDTFDPSGPVAVRHVVLCDAAPGMHTVQVVAGGRCNRRASGREVWVSEVVVTRLARDVAPQSIPRATGILTLAREESTLLVDANPSRRPQLRAHLTKPPFAGEVFAEARFNELPESNALAEAVRILQPNGKLWITAEHWSSVELARLPLSFEVVETRQSGTRWDLCAKRDPADSVSPLAAEIAVRLGSGREEQLRSVFPLLDQIPKPGACDDTAAAKLLHDTLVGLEPVGETEQMASWYRLLTQYSTGGPNLLGSAWYRLGVKLEQLQSWRKALEAYQTALPLIDNWPELSGSLRFHLADLLMASEAYEKALEHLTELRAIGLRPANLPTYRVALAEARCRLRLGQLAEARKLLSEIEQDEAASHYRLEAKVLRAEIEETNGDRDRALECYRAMIEDSCADDSLRLLAAHRIEALR